MLGGARLRPSDDCHEVGKEFQDDARDVRYSSWQLEATGSISRYGPSGASHLKRLEEIAGP